MKSLKVPVLLCAYRRPATTEKVFNAIREAQPPRLYVAVNAPNPQNKGEEDKVDEVKRISSNVDWDCKLSTLHRSEHLSLKTSIATAIDWFFENEEEGIILEDDCLPSLSFFYYCQDLLERYRNDNSIMHISGSNHGVAENTSESYFFSKHMHVWGWATWRRAWKLYDIQMKKWPKFRKEVNFEKFFGSEIEKQRKLLTWERAYLNKIDCWDYQWCYSVLTNGGMAISPTKNLIKNIGIGEDATHTFNVDSYHSLLTSQEMEFPLVHPGFKVVNYDLDFNYSYKNRIIEPTYFQKAKHRLKSIVKKILWSN